MSGWDDAQQTVNDADADAPRTFGRLKAQAAQVLGAGGGSERAPAGERVDADTAAALVGRIKAPPDPAVAIETFRKKFGVKKAIELKADQAAAVAPGRRTGE